MSIWTALFLPASWKGRCITMLDGVNASRQRVWRPASTFEFGTSCAIESISYILPCFMLST